MNEPTPKTNWSAFILIILFVVVLVGIFAYVIFSNNKKSAPTPAQTAATSVANSGTVRITKTGLDPKVIHIKKNGTITWVNKDSKVHQIKSDPHPLDNANSFLNLDPQGPSSSVQVKFEKTGTFTYHDENNPTNTQFQGEVEVE